MLRQVKKSGVDISRHFSKFFVSESKKNKNFATYELKNYIITENLQEQKLEDFENGVIWDF